MPDTLPTLAGNIARRVKLRPDGLIRSIQADGTVREQTFVEAWARGGSIASTIEGAGIGPGHQVVILVRDTLEYAPAFWGCLRAGATAVPLSGIATEAPDDELRSVLARLDRPAIVCDGSTPMVARVLALLPDVPLVNIADVVDAAEPNSHPEAPYPCLIATSGSTGRVKLVALHISAWLHRAYSQNYASRILDAAILGVFPFDSLNGYGALFLGYASWTQLPSRMLTIRPALVLEAVTRYRATNFQTTNSMAARLAELQSSELEHLDLSSLRNVGLGGETVTQRVAIAFREMLISRGARSNVLGAGYGTTETNFLLAGADPSTAPLDDSGAIKLGGCAAGNSVRIVDDDGGVLEEGQVGHIEISAPLTIFDSYWGEPDASRDCFTSDGWWKTGDLGVIDNGSLSLRGRLKQTLIVGGRKFSLADIEAHLQSDATVRRRSAAFIIRDKDGETDMLGVVLLREQSLASDDPTGDVEATRAAVVRRYGFAPAIVDEIDDAELPLTPTGKIDKSALTRRFVDLARNFSAVLVPASADRRVILQTLWSEVLDLGHSFDTSATFEELGGDSLRLATLFAGMEAKLGIAIALPEFFDDPTFDTLLTLAARAEPISANSSEVESLWALPFSIHRRILHFIEGWWGERVTADRILLGRNLGGARPPIFGVLNAHHEFVYLADALGDEQPFFAFRSAHEIGPYDEDLIQRLALRYVRDIVEVAPRGPIFILGQCQGGTIAVAIAQHLLRRGRHIPLLILSEWAFEACSYPEPVALLYGRDSTMNPKFTDTDPERAWRTAFADYESAEVAGAYGHLYDLPNVGSIAAEVSRLCSAALARPPRVAPSKSYQIKIEANVPWSLPPASAVLLDLIITNVGDLTIDSSLSELWVGSYWLQDGNPTGRVRSSRAPAMAIAPGATARLHFNLNTPPHPGYYTLFLDLVEHDVRWLGADREAWSMNVFVA